MHIVQTEGVGRETARRGGAEAIPVTAAIMTIGLPRGHVVAPPIARILATPGGIFPFRLGGQAIAAAGLGGKPLGIGPRILPADLHHRSVAPPPAHVIGQGTPGGLGKAIIFRKTDFPGGDGKGLELD